MKQIQLYILATLLATVLTSPGLAQELIATDETMGIYAEELSSWGMDNATNVTSSLTIPFDNKKLAGVGVAIHSDSTDIVSYDRLAPNQTDGHDKRGGHYWIRTYWGASDWLDVIMYHEWNGQCLFTLQPNAFTNFNIRRGFITLEYYK